MTYSAEGGSRFDALGNVYIKDFVTEDVCTTGTTTWGRYRYTLYRQPAYGGASELVGSFQADCREGSFEAVVLKGFGVDAINGLLHASLVRINFDDTGLSKAVPINVTIHGLPTLSEIMLSYQPPSTLSFNVPLRPEGLPGADSFALSSGDLRTVSDLSKAVPLECTVPAGRSPVPGEHLTVPDALPDPEAGQGRYYLASVRHADQVRAGRSFVDGVMQGRNAAALPACQ